MWGGGGVGGLIMRRDAPPTMSSYGGVLKETTLYSNSLSLSNIMHSIEIIQVLNRITNFETLVSCL